MIEEVSLFLGLERGPLVGALERAAARLDTESDALLRNHDYSADLPAADAVLIRKLLEAINHEHEATSPTARADPHAVEQAEIIADLVMLIGRLVRVARSPNSISAVPDAAVGYLRRMNLLGSPLRDVATPPCEPVSTPDPASPTLLTGSGLCERPTEAAPEQSTPPDLIESMSYRIATRADELAPNANFQLKAFDRAIARFYVRALIETLAAEGALPHLFKKPKE